MPDLRPNPTLRLEYRAEQPIHQAFLKQASRCPDATAIIAQHTTCSYTQLEQISQGIAAFLVENAASGADRVVIVASRSAALVYAMLGCLRAGLAFTVADAAYPAVRIEQIVSTLKPAVVLRCGEATVDAGQFIVAAVPEAPTAAQQAFPRQPVALPAVSPGATGLHHLHLGQHRRAQGHRHPPRAVGALHRLACAQHGFTQADTFSLLSGLGHDRCTATCSRHCRSARPSPARPSRP
jgi:non-ribosomal peptide synthetase component F